MFVQRLGAVVGLGLATLTVAPCLPARAIVKEEHEDPVEKCKRKCEEAWERENDRVPHAAHQEAAREVLAREQ